MPVFVSLLRAVNVGGNRKLPMADLRALYLSLGLEDPRTYIQSGNVVFRTSKRDPDALAVRIETAIERAFGFRSEVMLRSAAELRTVTASNPFLRLSEFDPSRVLITFLAAEPGIEARAKVLALTLPFEERDGEKVRIVGREIYMYCPNGMGKSTLPFALIAKTLKAPGTSRNWNTVMKLLEIAESMARE